MLYYIGFTTNLQEDACQLIPCPSTHECAYQGNWCFICWAGQISEELEHRIGIMETSLNRFGMILDSVQSDVMQVNKGTKEVLLASE